MFRTGTLSDRAAARRMQAAHQNRHTAWWVKGAALCSVTRLVRAIEANRFNEGKAN